MEDLQFHVHFQSTSQHSLDSVGQVNLWQHRRWRWLTAFLGKPEEGGGIAEDETMDAAAAFHPAEPRDSVMAAVRRIPCSSRTSVTCRLITSLPTQSTRRNTNSRPKDKK